MRLSWELVSFSEQRTPLRFGASQCSLMFRNVPNKDGFEECLQEHCTAMLKRTWSRDGEPPTYCFLPQVNYLSSHQTKLSRA